MAIYNLVDPASMQGEVRSGYSKCAYSLIQQRLLAPACKQPSYVRQVCTVTSCSGTQLAIMHCYSSC